mmetsp:Transcript_128207/g.409890  ORF Transcript_128207/g.409890 Transcript_128207/m.409890 type:complete len:218 (-) Transcript_128207:108-761(-)
MHHTIHAQVHAGRCDTQNSEAHAHVEVGIGIDEALGTHGSSQADSLVPKMLRMPAAEVLCGIDHRVRAVCHDNPFTSGLHTSREECFTILVRDLLGILLADTRDGKIEVWRRDPLEDAACCRLSDLECPAAHQARVGFVDCSSSPQQQHLGPVLCTPPLRRRLHAGSACERGAGTPRAERLGSEHQGGRRLSQPQEPRNVCEDTGHDKPTTHWAQLR